ncbi:MAG: hypothetical protein J7513_07855 [Solirubrobacteraceae bacterium]|nr:hypothetical protein [Solirubrobacteraceae bacterium]
MIRLRSFLAAGLLGAVCLLPACGDETAEAPRATAVQAARSTPISADYVGLVAPEVLPLPDAEQLATLRAQHAAGVGVLRQTFRWDEIEPSKGRWAWGMHDQLVGNAARAGITILPIVFQVRPDQAAAAKPGVKVTATTTMPPKDPAVFAGFATELVKRYGPGGTFWAEHPDIPERPVHSWQVWNEPNLKAYWGGRPNDREYGRLLVVTAKAIRAADPKAEIVTGGLPQSKQGISIKDYIHLLAKSAPKGTFDTLAIHPYGRTADTVITGAAHAREWLDREGLTSVNLWITEFGWATGGPKSPFTVGPKRQARQVTEVLDRSAALRTDLRLRGVIYYSWRDVPPYEGGRDFWGLHTGLNTLEGEAKPALQAFTDEIAALRDR